MSEDSVILIHSPAPNIFHYCYINFQVKSSHARNGDRDVHVMRALREGAGLPLIDYVLLGLCLVYHVDLSTQTMFEGRVNSVLFCVWFCVIG